MKTKTDEPNFKVGLAVKFWGDILMANRRLKQCCTVSRTSILKCHMNYDSHKLTVVELRDFTEDGDATIAICF